MEGFFTNDGLCHDPLHLGCHLGVLVEWLGVRAVQAAARGCRQHKARGEEAVGRVRLFGLLRPITRAAPGPSCGACEVSSFCYVVNTTLFERVCFRVACCWCERISCCTCTLSTLRALCRPPRPTHRLFGACAAHTAAAAAAAAAANSLSAQQRRGGESKQTKKPSLKVCCFF